MTDKKSLFEEFWRYKGTNLFQTYKVTATLLKDADCVDRVIKAGTKVRIWMVSRFGDIGITDNLGKGCYGYCGRVGGGPEARNPGSLEEWVTDIEWPPENPDDHEKLGWV